MKRAPFWLGVLLLSACGADPEGEQCREVRGIEGTGLQGIQGTGLQGIQGTGRQVQSSKPQGIQGSGLRSDTFKGAAQGAQSCREVRGIEGSGLQGIVGSGLQGIVGSGAPAAAQAE